jgi:hypothetical protein
MSVYGPVAGDMGAEPDCPWFLDSWLEEHPEFPLAETCIGESDVASEAASGTSADAPAGYFLG